MSTLQTSRPPREIVRRRLSSARPCAARDVPPARWQAQVLLCWGALCCSLGAVLLLGDERGLGYEASRPATPLLCGAVAMAAAAIALLRGRRGGLTLDERGCRVATARSEAWIPWTAVSGAHVEHGWATSHVVLALADGAAPLRLSCARLRREPHRLRNLVEGWRCAARHEPYRRMPAPLWEPRRTPRRIGLGTLLVVAIAVSLAPLQPVGLYPLPWLVAPLAVALPAGLRAICLGDGRELDDTLRRHVRDHRAAGRAWGMSAALLAAWLPLVLATTRVFLGA